MKKSEHLDQRHSSLQERSDPLTPEKRSWLMSRIRSKDTKPELTVRRIVFSLGYRYRLHRRDLPGQPDLVFSSKKKVIFVHGCFWHMHMCKDRPMPKTNATFWINKLEGNRARDHRNRRKLTQLGWKSLVLWECQLKDVAKLTCRIRKFLGDDVAQKINCSNVHCDKRHP